MPRLVATVAVALLTCLVDVPGAGACDWRLVDRVSSFDDPRFSAVEARSASDVWVVGERWVRYARRPGGFARAWTARWDGTSLRSVRNPVGVGRLLDVAVRDGEVWAVGRARGRPLVQRLEDGRWRTIPAPRTGTELWDVEIVAPGRIWVVADSGLLHERAAGRWRRVPGSPGGIDGLELGARGDVWALRRGGDARWDGSRWSVPDSRFTLNDVAGVWASGQRGSGPPNVLLRWDGQRWRHVPHRFEPVDVETSAFLFRNRSGAGILELRGGRRRESYPLPWRDALPIYDFASAGSEAWLVSSEGLLARFACPA